MRPRRLIAVMLRSMLGAGVMLAGPAIAEKQLSDEAVLQARIHLPDGAMTLGAVASELSKQTGAKIEAQECLADRKLTMCLGEVTVRQALDALAELNDWTWRRTKPGHWLIARPTIHRSEVLAEVPNAMQASLPKDLRDYLGLTEWNKRPPQQRTGVRGAWNRALTGLNPDKEAVVYPLIARLATEDSVPYTKLTDDDKERLLWYLLFRHFGETDRLLYDMFLGTHQIEPEKAVLELQNGGMLEVKLYVPEVEGVTAFGAAVPIP